MEDPAAVRGSLVARIKEMITLISGGEVGGGRFFAEGGGECEHLLLVGNKLRF